MSKKLFFATIFSISIQSYAQNVPVPQFQLVTATTQVIGHTRSETSPAVFRINTKTGQVWKYLEVMIDGQLVISWLEVPENYRTESVPQNR